MAITAALLTAAGDATDLASYATASITPTANHLVLAAVFSEGLGAEEIPTATGNGLTWVEVLSVAEGTSHRITVLRAMGATPSAEAVTFDFGGATQLRCGWSIVEFAGVDTSGTNGSGAVVQSKGASSAAATAGAADFDAAFGDAVNHATYSALMHRNANNTVVEGSFTELSDVVTEAISLQVMWLLGEDQTPAPTWSGSVGYAQIVVEIKATTGGSAHTATLTDPEGLLDSIAAVADYLRSQDDALGLTDSVTYELTQSVTITDPLGMVDDGQWFEVAPDALGLTDSVSYQIQSAGSVTATDPLGLTDSLTVDASIVVTITDSLGLTDSVSSGVTGVTFWQPAPVLYDPITAGDTPPWN